MEKGAKMTMKRKPVLERKTDLTNVYRERRHCEQVYQLALLGLTEREISDAMGISCGVYTEWKKRYPEFVAARNEGKHNADAKVAASLFTRAIGYSHPDTKVIFDAKNGEVLKVEVEKVYPPDVTACIFWLKMRHRGLWNDSVQVDMNHSGNVTLSPGKLSDLTDEELALAEKIGMKQLITKELQLEKNRAEEGYGPNTITNEDKDEEWE